MNSENEMRQKECLITDTQGYDRKIDNTKLSQYQRKH